MQVFGNPLIAALFTAIVAGSPGRALAADPMTDGGVLHWHCTQERGEYHDVLCLPRVIAAGPAGGFAVRPLAVDPYWEDVLGSAPAATATAPRSSGRAGMAGLQGRDLRPVAMRGQEEVSVPGGWRIPLFTRPGEPRAVVELLRTVLCGDVSCTVHYDRYPALSASR